MSNRSYPFIKPSSGGVILDLKLTPRAKREGVAGVHGDRLKVSVTAPPVDSKANEQLISYLSWFCGCPKSAVVIKQGATSRLKSVLLKGVTPEVLAELLDEALNDD